ncbi:Predicted PurR-regulated permease PerM [Bhargavaea beijingensis]|uniref:Predicted PurR-regulated permease PerM n=2 Tax=Bhargavaea beijingensis TaxID=426756 RepID=A0A1G6YPR0_9BACL|nr:Predicted PurR-regulated permease PerM [Bhargavaea beijingensis]
MQNSKGVPMTKKLWFQAGVGILLALLIIHFFIDIKGLFSPIGIILRAIFLPLLVGGVLFYLTEPVQRYLEKRNFPRWASILSVLVLIVGVFWGLSAMVGPMITKQVNSFTDNLPQIIEEAQDTVSYVLDRRDELPEFLENAIEDARDRVNEIALGIGGGMVNFITGFFQTIFMLVLAPFFLVYMLKDHERFTPFVSQFFSGKKKAFVINTLEDVNRTISNYVQGQMLVSICVGIMLLIGYLIIGLEYALILAIFGLFMNLIPFIGPWISVIPALLIALIQDPKLLIGVGIVMLVAQQIESNFITPNIMGKTLDIHPLTVITVILAAGNLAGFVGVLLGVPLYAVGKTIVKNIYEAREKIREAATSDVAEE